MLIRQQYDQAEYTLSGVLTQEPHYIPALFGKIALLDRKQDYKGCLSLYQTILLIDPEIQPDVRVPLGVCFQKCGMYKEARAAYERALARDPKNVDALSLLSILDGNASKKQGIDESVALKYKKNSSQNILKAFELNKKHPLVSIEMAKRFLDRQQLDKAFVLIENGIKNTSTDLLLADALYLKACILHQKVNFL